MPTVNRAIKYRIHPSEEQMTQLLQTFGCVRKVFNAAIELQEGLYAAKMGSMSKMDLNNHVNRVMKEDAPYLKEVDKFALTNAVYHVAAGYKNFFEGRAKHPRFKSRKDSKQSYTTNWTNGNIKVIPPEKKGTVRGKVKLPKLGLVDAVIHRVPPEDWVIKSATVSMNNSGQYFVSVLFAYEQEPTPYIPMPNKGRAIGLDYSSPDFYVDSDGNDAGVPHFYRTMEAKLAREQRRLSKMTKGSNNYAKQKIKVDKLHRKIANQRKDFCHKLSRKIANSYDAVCVEDIDLRAMSRSLNLGKSTMDNGFGMFRVFLQYKLERQGKYFVVVDRWFPSSKTCNHCGYINRELQLSDRVWVCPHCGEVILRDPNAAKNILEEGLGMLYDLLVPLPMTA